MHSTKIKVVEPLIKKGLRITCQPDIYGYHHHQQSFHGEHRMWLQTVCGEQI
jgi:hypothetical protein